MASKNEYWFSQDMKIGYGRLSTGEVFCFDVDDYDKISGRVWYRCNRSTNTQTYVGDCRGLCIHRIIIDAPSGYEVDHINLNPLDNRKSNLRVCTHQQNQCNQPLQKNNTSGVTGVNYYAPRGKYRARIKFFQKELHLGYFDTFLEAVQARDIGMKNLFGDFGRYSESPPPAIWLREKVQSRCSRFINEAVFDCREEGDSA